MALYLGSNKKNLYNDSYKLAVEFYSPIPITNGIRLITSDDYLLKDIKNLFLTVKESE